MKRLFLLTIVTLLCWAADPLAASDAPRVIDEDGPAQGIQPLVLNELWRVGGDDEDVIFGRITDLVRHPDGRLLVLDNQLCHVVVLSPDGEYLGDISREGDGPGEVRQPTGLVLLSDDVIGIGAGFPAKLNTLKLDGTPLETYYPVGEPAEGNVAVMISLQYVDGVLGATGGSIVFVPDGPSYTDRFLSVGDGTLADFHRILETTTPMDPTGFTFVEVDRYYIDVGWALGPGGRIYAPMKRDVYEISEFDTQGNLVRVFGRKYQLRKRTTADKAQVSPTINPGTPENTDWTISDYDPCILRIMVHPDDGTIWVLTPHGQEEQPDHILESWDVFSPEGEYLREAPVPLGNEMNEGTCFLVGDGRLVVVRGTGSVFTSQDIEEEDAEIEPLEVICYEMQ